MISPIPYVATGFSAKPVVPIHSVAIGISDSQNNRCRLAQRILPFTFFTV
jgi:hypothetical protein